MKFWQSLAFVEMEQTVELAHFCEELGFYGVSCGDHLVTTREQVDEYLYRDNGNVFWDPDTHWPDPWVLSAAIAQATSTLRFLSTVYILPLRDPLSAAKAVSTAAYLSGDRIELGIGVGWQKAEFEMNGQNFHNRGKRCDEQIEILRGLMSGAMTQFQGEYYQIPEVKMSPGTKQRVPIMVGGYAPAAMRRAARNDGWMATAHEEQELYPLLQQLNSIRAEQGLSDKPFEVWSGIKNPEDGSHQRLEEAGVTMTNGTNFLDDKGQICPSSLDDKKRKLEAFAKQYL